jgi:nucleotide-binding universal stress UspA family protein
MIVVVWVAHGGWHAAVDAARSAAPPDAEIVLLHVLSGEVEEVVHGAFAGLLGRHRSAPVAIDESAVAAGQELLDAASTRLGRDARQETRSGRIEREVVAAAANADLLVVSRDGDRSRLGPHSLGPTTRFVVDHAPCAVLLVWPAAAPSVDSIPPPPTHPPGHRPGHPPEPGSGGPHPRP